MRQMGKKLPASVLESVDYDFYPKHYLSPKPLTLGEIGCAISHIKVYEHMVENNIKSAIILEDDAIVSQHFKEIVEDTLNKINKNHELIFLITEKLNPIFLRNGLWKDIDLHYKAPSKIQEDVLSMQPLI